MFKILTTEDKFNIQKLWSCVFYGKRAYNWILHEPYFEWATNELMKREDKISLFGKTYDEIYRETLANAKCFSDKEIVTSLKNAGKLAYDCDSPVSYDEVARMAGNSFDRNFGDCLYNLYFPEKMHDAFNCTSLCFIKDFPEAFIDKEDNSRSYVVGDLLNEFASLAKIMQDMHYKSSKYGNFSNIDSDLLDEKDPDKSDELANNLYNCYMEEGELIRNAALERYWYGVVLFLTLEPKILNTIEKNIKRKTNLDEMANAGKGVIRHFDWDLVQIKPSVSLSDNEVYDYVDDFCKKFK